MALPKRQTSKRRRDERRAHDAIESRMLSVCTDCGAKKLDHHACPECGRYDGKQVINVK